MKRYVEYEVEGGRTVIIEVEEAARGFVPAARPGELTVKAAKSFEEAMETIRPITEKLVAKLHDMTESPDQIGVEFGLKLGFEAGAVIASGSAEANFKVSLTWKRERGGK